MAEKKTKVASEEVITNFEPVIEEDTAALDVVSRQDYEAVVAERNELVAQYQRVAAAYNTAINIIAEDYARKVAADYAEKVSKSIFEQVDKDLAQNAKK